MSHRRVTEQNTFRTAFNSIRNTPGIDESLSAAKEYLIRIQNAVSEPILIQPSGTRIYEYIGSIQIGENRYPQIRVLYFLGTGEVSLLHIELVAE